MQNDPALLKVAERSPSCAAWSPCAHRPQLLATGSLQGMLSDDFQSSAFVEIWDASKTSSAAPQELVSLCKFPAPACFSKLAWSPVGSDSGKHPLGILAGGMQDGSLCLWDPQRAIDQQDAQLHTQKVHTMAVADLHFHPRQAHFLASVGGAKLMLWDVQNAESPVVRPFQEQAEASNASLTTVRWNPQKDC
ncbi:MAG: hypothetical protein MHM6MM_009308, partial [Cercozoa sp. M6MM]